MTTTPVPPPALVPTGQGQGTRYGNDEAQTAPGTPGAADSGPPLPEPAGTVPVNPPRRRVDHPPLPGWGQ